METSDDASTIGTPIREPPARPKSPEERRYWAERFLHLCRINPGLPQITLAARVATGARVNPKTVIAWAQQVDGCNVGSKTMSKSSKRKPAPSTETGASSQAIAPVPEPAPAAVAVAHVHGPRKPRGGVFGVDRLRQVMSASAELRTETLCDDAASELEKLRQRADKPAPWSEDR